MVEGVEWGHEHEKGAQEQQIKQEFGIVQQLFQRVQKEYTQKLPHFQELSIGMSGDYILAQEFGSTMVRVGSAVFK